MSQAAEAYRAPCSAADPETVRPYQLSRVNLRRSSLGVIVPIFVLTLWEAVVWFGLANARLLPPPSQVLHTLAALLAAGELWSHASTTLLRVLGGFTLGVAAGTVLGAATGYSRLLRDLFDPLLQGLRAVPSLAWVPLFILWFGIFEASKISLIAAGVFFPIYLGTMGAVANVDRKLVEVGLSYALTPVQLIRRILLPATLPAYVVALRGGLGLGWMFVVAAELMGASEGLGYLLVDGQQMGKPAQVIAAIVCFTVLGKLTDGLLVAVTSPLLRWQDTIQR